MWRWIRNTFILFSLLICIAASVFCVRSLSLEDYILWDISSGSPLTIASIDQRLMIASMNYGSAPLPEPIILWGHSALGSYESTHSIEGFLDELRNADHTVFEFLGVFFFERSKVMRSPFSRLPNFVIIIPYWFIVPPAALLPLWWLLRGRRSSKHYRRKHGLCVKCGYDLRGTTGACPECGSTTDDANPSPGVT